jgi:selenocysteine-specific elongation factor
MVALPETLSPSHMVDVTLHYLSSNPKKLKNRTRVRFHSGTSEMMGNVVLLDRDELNPGEDAFAQIRLENPVSLIRDDRYVLRSYSPVRTIGGGRVINPIPAKHKPNKPDVIDHLKTLTSDDMVRIVQQLIRATGYTGCRYQNLRIMANIPEKQLAQLLQTMLSQKHIVRIDKDTQTFMHHRVFADIQNALQTCISNYHRNYPLKPGIPKEELKTKLPRTIGNKTFLIALAQMNKAGLIKLEEDIVYLSDHKVTLAVDQEDLKSKILSTYSDSGLTPPYFKEVCRELDAPVETAKEVLALLIKENRLIKVKDDLYYHKKHLEQLKGELVDYLVSNDEITTPQFKDMTGASRKYVIPLIEYFDSIQLTIRVGDMRKLRRQPG